MQKYSASLMHNQNTFQYTARLATRNSIPDSIWKHLLFGLSASQDLLQARVYWANKEEQDKPSTWWSEQPNQFNSDKCPKTQNSISFFNNLYTDNGIQPDPAKIRDNKCQLSKTGLQRFMGMLTYFTLYIPKFAEKAHTLRRLLKNEVPWVWDTDHQKCF